MLFSLTSVLPRRLASYECGMPAGSVKIRVETIAHYLERYAGDIIRKKTELMPPGCPLRPRAAEVSLTGV